MSASTHLPRIRRQQPSKRRAQLIELWDGRWWPGRTLHGLPAFEFHRAPSGLLTRRQLRDKDLSPGGQEPFARLVWNRDRCWAWLYVEELARPKRTPTAAQLEALEKALAARKVCAHCGPVEHCVRTTDRLCGDCHAAGVTPSDEAGTTGWRVLDQWAEDIAQLTNASETTTATEATGVTEPGVIADLADRTDATSAEGDRDMNNDPNYDPNYDNSYDDGRLSDRGHVQPESAVDTSLARATERFGLKDARRWVTTATRSRDAAGGQSIDPGLLEAVTDDLRAAARGAYERRILPDSEIEHLSGITRTEATAQEVTAQEVVAGHKAALAGLAGFSLAEQATIRNAVADRAADHFGGPLNLGRDDAARYLAEGPLGDLTDQHGLRRVWDAVAAVIDEDESVLTASQDERDRIRSARAARVDELNQSAATAAQAGNFGEALRLLDALEAIDPAYRPGQRSISDIRNMLRTKHSASHPASHSASHAAGRDTAQQSPLARPAAEPTHEPSHEPSRDQGREPSAEPDGARWQVTRVLVTGSRDWTNSTTIAEALAPFRVPGTVLVHGDARGADRIAGAIWKSWGLPVEPHSASWESCGSECRPEHRRRRRDGVEYCPTAGQRRNQEMVAAGADVCLAFIKDRSRGATHCADRAEAAGIATRRHLSTSHASADKTELGYTRRVCATCDTDWPCPEFAQTLEAQAEADAAWVVAIQPYGRGDAAADDAAADDTDTSTDTEGSFRVGDRVRRTDTDLVGTVTYASGGDVDVQYDGRHRHRRVGTVRDFESIATTVADTARSPGDTDDTTNTGDAAGQSVTRALEAVARCRERAEQVDRSLTDTPGARDDRTDGNEWSRADDAARWNDTTTATTSAACDAAPRDGALVRSADREPF